MNDNEFPIDETTELEQWTDYIPDTESEDTIWGEELDQYLEYIDRIYQTDNEPVEDLEPYVDTNIYGAALGKTNRKRRKKRSSGKNHNILSIIVVVLILALAIGGVWALYHFSDIFPKKNSKPDMSANDSANQTTTTEEPATEEEPYGPYATTDYIVHTPHVTDNTIVFDSNPYSLKFSDAPAPTDNSGEESEGDSGTDDIYSAITLTPVEGSLNATEPDVENPAETQQLTSKYMVLVDLSDDSIVAKRDSDVVINPASMTKILTVLTATDMIEDLDDTYVITPEEVQYVYEHGCSVVGFLEGETVTVRDLIYGTIVCSGADAAMGLAEYCCGSQEAFVEKMNQKVEDLGLSATAHFTNVIGMYDEDLHCTMEDMAVILATAIQNDLCRDVLSTRIYTTTPDPSLLPDKAKNTESDTSDGQTDNTETGDTSSDDGQTTNTEGGDTPSDDGQAANTEAGDTSSDDGQTANTEDGDTPSDDGQTANTEAGDTPSDDGQTTNTEDGDTPSDDGQAANTEAGDTPSDDGQTSNTDDDHTLDDVPETVLLVATKGIEISNWFMRRIEDKQTGGEVLGAKTGYVSMAGSCAASYYKSASGKEYICVTGDTYNSWRCIYDHVGIYRSLAK